MSEEKTQKLNLSVNTVLTASIAAMVSIGGAWFVQFEKAQHAETLNAINDATKDFEKKEDHEKDIQRLTQWIQHQNENKQTQNN